MFFHILRDLSNISIKNRVITLSNFSNIIVGAGLCYAIENEEYYNIPIIVFFPSIFTGYNMYKNRREIENSLKSRLSLEVPPLH
jgi:hypothetical protein